MGSLKSVIIGNTFEVSTTSEDAGLGVEALPWHYGGLPIHSSRERPATRAFAPLALPDTRNALRVSPAANPWARPVQAADVAQARLFDEILQSEIAELDELAEAAERRWLRRRERGPGADTPPAPLLRLRERAAEVRRLLGALRDRFPDD
ncbi:MAG: hypothetical protein JWR37_2778 [Mycobacterium sp.]|nr:hypothetical protein [Mycobacterium sp.]